MTKKSSNYSMQEVFIKHLKELTPSNISLADDLAELLEISVDSAYRRLRNETALSLDETYKICKHYRISADGLFASNVNAVTCNYIKLTDTEENLVIYLTGILNSLKQVSKSNHSKLIYAAEEVPIFHSFYSKKLATFKLFYWQRSVLNISKYQAKKFDWNIIPESQLNLCDEIYATYLKTNSTEIWTTDTIQTNIKQIEYYYESGTFNNKEDAIELLNELKAMIENIHQFAEKENKNTQNNSVVFPLSLYKSDLVIGTNCIHVKADDVVTSFISFNSLNSLSTFNSDFCEEIEHWMKNLIKKSTLISGTAEKERFQFFNKTHKAIDACIERIKND